MTCERGGKSEKDELLVANIFIGDVQRNECSTNPPTPPLPLPSPKSNSGNIQATKII